jgi:Carboxypeptidase regulatory-like domain
MNQPIRFFCFLALLLSSVLAFGQGSGSIVGTVTDPSGAVVVGATVTVTNVGTGASRTTTTNQQGGYSLSAMPPAQYKITIEAPAFRTYSQTGATLQANQTLTVNAKLEVGQTTETVEVSGQALQVDTATSTVKDVVDQQRVVELPLNGRNAAELTLTTTGAVTVPNSGSDQGATKTFPGAVTISVNGARENQISYQLDGGNYMDEYTNVNQPFPFPDALQEFSVQSSNYTAEFGQNAGAVVNVVTKSGTNAIHGDVFEFVRNQVFNAKSWQSTTGVDQLKRNQFGGTFGGPLIKDKTFFFAGFQGTTIRNFGGESSKIVPSAAQRATATDPVSIALLQHIPVGDASNKVSYGKPDSQDFQQVIARGDQVLGANDQLTLRYVYNRFKRLGIFDTNNLLTYQDGSRITAQNALIHETHVFSGTKVNSFRFSYAREHASRGPASGAFSLQSLGIVGGLWDPVAAIQHVRVQSGFDFGDNPNAAFVRNNFSLSDDYSWVTGRHELHIGGTLEKSRVDLRNNFFSPGEFNFSSMANFLAGKLSGYGSGDSAPAFRQGQGEFKDNRNTFAGLYVQDNIRATRRLTLNLGLRWEPGLTWREGKDRWMQFRLTDAINNNRSAIFENAPPGLFFPGDVGFPANGRGDAYKLFAPRVGFALDLFGDGKTSLRGGAGIFYDSRDNGITNNRMVDEHPFSPQFILGTAVPAGSFSDPLCTLAATQTSLGCSDVSSTYILPISLPAPRNIPFPDGQLWLGYDPNNNWQVPTVYNWNFVLERQLPSGFLLRAGYIGSRSTHGSESVELNQYPYGGTGCSGGCNSLKAPRTLNSIVSSQYGLSSQLYGNVQVAYGSINSRYNSLQLGLTHRGKTLTFTGNYTLSRSTDTSTPAGLSALPWDDPNRHAFDNGPSIYDHTHRFVGTYVIALPGMPNANGFAKAVLGGWQLSGIVSAQTGRPFTVFSGKDNSGLGLGNDRAVQVGDPYGGNTCAGVTKPCKSYLDPAAFTVNPILTVGTVAKGSLRYPGYFDVDMGLQKNFNFTERWRLEFRAEFFNVFNRVNFDDGLVNGNTSFTKVSSGAKTFGALTASKDPRIGQLALKLHW